MSIHYLVKNDIIIPAPAPGRLPEETKMSKKKAKKKPVKKKPLGVGTLTVHSGEQRVKYADALTVPIVQTSTYAFKEYHVRDLTAPPQARSRNSS